MEKFNSGAGAVVCEKCRRIIAIGQKARNNLRYIYTTKPEDHIRRMSKAGVELDYCSKACEEAHFAGARENKL